MFAMPVDLPHQVIERDASVFLAKSSSKKPDNKAKRTPQGEAERQFLVQECNMIERNCRTVYLSDGGASSSIKHAMVLFERQVLNKTRSSFFLDISVHQYFLKSPAFLHLLPN